MTNIKNYLSIRKLMNIIPGKQGVIVMDYVTGRLLEQSDANGFVEFIRNNCCIDFDGEYEVYGVEVQGGMLVIKVCSREGVHYISVPVYSESVDRNGDYEIIGYRKEYIR